MALLIDTSGSIVERPPFIDNWVQMRQFLRDFVRQIKTSYPNVNIALEDFRNQGNVRFNFQDCANNSNIQCMDNIIRSMTTPVSTNCLNGLYNSGGGGTSTYIKSSGVWYHKYDIDGVTSKNSFFHLAK